jgi:hypothetical protein
MATSVLYALSKRDFEADAGTILSYAPICTAMKRVRGSPSGFGEMAQCACCCKSFPPL